MKKELQHFNIENSYGGNQEWFKGFFMKIGGCAAETACEICIYLDLYKKTALYPFDVNNLTKADYINFASIMKPFLHPRMGGVNRLSTYKEGFEEYFKSRNEKIAFTLVEGNESLENAKNALISQIDSGYPAAYLCLKHKNRSFRDYEWHWFLINGYDESENGFFVKAVTYSAFEWLDFEKLWETGYEFRGGMVLLQKM